MDTPDHNALYLQSLHIGPLNISSSIRPGTTGYSLALSYSKSFFFFIFLEPVFVVCMIEPFISSDIPSLIGISLSEFPYLHSLLFYCHMEFV